MSESELMFETNACKICELKEKCEKIPSIQPLNPIECPHSIRISIFQYRQLCTFRKLLGSL